MKNHCKIKYTCDHPWEIGNECIFADFVSKEIEPHICVFADDSLKFYQCKNRLAQISEIHNEENII